MKDRYHRHLKTITTELLINAKSCPNENMDKEVIFHPRENEKGREKYANISKQLVIGEIKKQVKVTRNSHTEWVKKKRKKTLTASKANNYTENKHHLNICGRTVKYTFTLHSSSDASYIIKHALI